MEQARMMLPKVAGLLALGALLLSGCLKTEKYPVEPAISQKSFALDNDTANALKLTIKFTDGDGDIGLDDSYNYAPYDRNSAYYYNMLINFQLKENGSWIDAQQLYPYRLPVITPTGQNKALNGEIEVTMWPFPGPLLPDHPVIDHGDTVRATVKLIDRALHESNVITTSELKLP